jgi:flagellar motor switch protein FliG
VRRIQELEPGRIHSVLRTERAQTIALVVSCLPPHKASAVLGLLAPEAREQTVERLATLGPTPVEVIDRVVDVLLQKAGPVSAQAVSRTGGLKAAATLLNAFDRNETQKLLTSLEERNPDLGQAIRQKMFTFEDLVRLEASSLQRLLRDVDLRDLALALKTASDQLKTALLGCISKRAAQTVAEEMGFLGATKVRDIEAAQLRIVGVLRRLESDGEIDLGGEQPEATA